MQGSEKDSDNWSRSGTHGEVTPEIYEGSVCAAKHCKYSPHSLRELEVTLALQGHKNIIQVLGSTVTTEEVIIYMECIPQTLHDILTAARGGSLDLETAHKYFLQLVEGIQYIHSKGYVHKDVKLENILVGTNDLQSSEPETIRLIDFGFALPYQKGKTMIDDKGSYHYASPEIWLRIPHEGPSVDVWAMGVVLYLLVAGYFPFEGQTPAEIFGQIGRNQLEFPEYLLAPQHASLRDLILRMLTYDLHSRISVDEILCHPWVVGAQFNPEKGQISLSASSMNLVSEGLSGTLLFLGHSKGRAGKSSKSKKQKKTSKRASKIHPSASGEIQDPKPKKKGFLRSLARLFS